MSALGTALKRVPGARRGVHAARDLRHLLRDPGVGQWLAYQRDRRTAAYARAWTDPDPLVSICIATYNRGRLVAERSVASALAQTHRNVEVVVIGDHCTDDTAERMAAITDPRLRFTNLPERGRYPENPQHRWMVAGTTPMNHALSLARGQWVTHLDDDDEHAPTRVAALLDFVRATRAELAWHPFRSEFPDGWRINDAPAFARGAVTTSSIFYHKWLKRIAWDIEAWKTETPGDWHRLQRIRLLGPRMRRHPEPLLDHYLEQSQRRP